MRSAKPRVPTVCWFVALLVGCATPLIGDESTDELAAFLSTTPSDAGTRDSGRDAGDAGTDASDASDASDAADAKPPSDGAVPGEGGATADSGAGVCLPCSDTRETPIGDCGCAVPPTEFGPLPAEGFQCPAAQIQYCTLSATQCTSCIGGKSERRNSSHFDCDDFADTCAQYMYNAGIDGCSVSFCWETDPGKPRPERECTQCGTKFEIPRLNQSCHAINSARKNDTESCLYEPQSNTPIVCWTGDPDNPPVASRKAACEKYGGVKGGGCNFRSFTCQTPTRMDPGDRPGLISESVCQQMKDACPAIPPDAGPPADAGSTVDAGPLDDPCAPLNKFECRGRLGTENNCVWEGAGPCKRRTPRTL